jgi:hypothetical protein
MSRVTDPLERQVATSLDIAGIAYIHESDSKGTDRTRGLDFYVPSINVYIEIKQFHSPRIEQQMSRVENIIVLQGAGAVRAFIHLLHKPEQVDKPPAGETT